jgi:hypothetical protein
VLGDQLALAPEVGVRVLQRRPREFQRRRRFMLARFKIARVQLGQGLSFRHRVADSNKETAHHARNARPDADLGADHRLDDARRFDDRPDVAPRHAHDVRTPNGIACSLQDPAAEDGCDGDPADDDKCENQLSRCKNPLKVRTTSEPGVCEGHMSRLFQVCNKVKRLGAEVGGWRFEVGG